MGVITAASDAFLPKVSPCLATRPAYIWTPEKTPLRKMCIELGYASQSAKNALTLIPSLPHTKLPNESFSVISTGDAGRNYVAASTTTPWGMGYMFVT